MPVSIPSRNTSISITDDGSKVALGNSSITDIFLLNLAYGDIVDTQIIAGTNGVSIKKMVNTNDYTYEGQHNMQLRIRNGMGIHDSRALEIGLLENGTGIIQANESGIGYNNLALNPVNGNVGIGTTTPDSDNKLHVNGTARIADGTNMYIDSGSLTRTNRGGSYNVGIGFNCGKSGSSGNKNVLLGIDCAANHLSSGSYNTLIGSRAGRTITTGSYNVIVSGMDGGDNKVSSGNTNTIIGHNAGFPSWTQRNYSTALGYNAKITKDNQLVLGDGSTEVYIPNRIGIGTSTPEDKLRLHVHSDIGSKDIFKVTSDNATGHAGIVIENTSTNGGQFFMLASGTGWDLQEDDETSKLIFGAGASSTTNTKMTMTDTGRLGIGTKFPAHRFHVIKGDTYVKNGTYMNNTNDNISHSDIYTFDDIGIFTDGYIVGSRIAAHSDRRIKTNIVDVPDDLALQQVRDIPCRYYEYTDKVTKGTKKTIGFIAQEVKEVLPMAITYITEFIPDEYRPLENISWEEIVSDISGNSTYKMSSDLTDVSGITYRFMVSNDLSENAIKKEIVGNSDGTFTFDASYQQVFCYGKKVDDFHAIDKTQIFALHHSAIQEIDRLQLEEKDKVAALETKNTELETKVATLETKNTELETRINTIMAILSNNNLT
jgi:hypothetical protein